MKDYNQLLPGCCTNIVILLWEELLHHQTGAIAGGRLPIRSTSLLQSKKPLLFQFALSIVVLPEDHEKKQLGPGGRKHRENACFEILPHSINCMRETPYIPYLWKWKLLHGSV